MYICRADDTWIFGVGEGTQLNTASAGGSRGKDRGSGAPFAVEMPMGEDPETRAGLRRVATRAVAIQRTGHTGGVRQAGRRRGKRSQRTAYCGFRWNEHVSTEC